MKPIHYLVFSGGGAAGAAYGGALQQLEFESEFSIKNIRGVAGASAGAITALLVGLNFSASEINQKLRTIDFQNLEDGGFFINETGRLFSKYGKYKGEALFSLIKSFIQEKFPTRNPAEVTFNDIKDISGIDLYIVTTKNFMINGDYKNKTKVFSTEKHGNTPIANIIRTSASAPVYFARNRLRKVEKGRYLLGDETNHLYNDGGINLNYPIEIFDHPKYLPEPHDGDDSPVNPHVLGFALLEQEDISHEIPHLTKEVILDNHPLKYFSGLIGTSLFNSTKVALEKRANRERTVEIDRKNISLAEFNLSDEKKEELILSGAQAVKDYFASKRGEKKELIDGQLYKTLLNQKISQKLTLDEAEVSEDQGCFCTMKLW